jgi:hypothetical protein
MMMMMEHRREQFQSIIGHFLQFRVWLLMFRALGLQASTAAAVAEDDHHDDDEAEELNEEQEQEEEGT